MNPDEQNDAWQQRREHRSSCDGRGDRPRRDASRPRRSLRRAIIIGSVNVIASATLAYAGHAARMINLRP